MRRYFPDLEAYRSAARDHDIIPVYRQLLADHLTPVSAFQLLGGENEHAFLLESVIGGEKVGRYSFIATNPRVVYEVSGGKAKLTHHSSPGNTSSEWKTSDPLADLQKLMPAGRFHRWPNLPPFTGGLVGYAGYDTIRYYEGEQLPKPPTDDRRLPDLLFGLYGELVVFDHVDKTIRVVANAIVDRGQRAEGRGQTAGETGSTGKGASDAGSPSALCPLPSALSSDPYADACARIDAIVAKLQRPASLGLGEIDPTAPLSTEFVSNMEREEFEAAVSAGKEYIRAGDIFQFVPSQRLRATCAAKPLDVYRALRIINPSPFMFYLKTPACTLIGSSPEILVRVEGGKATTRPLAGTRRRGATATEDKLLEAELLADPKERAEHIMLVDLHRNDIGRVSKVGSVRVDDVMTVERYSHVMHITTNVTGQLEAGMTSFDALRVSLPVGTVSGAPKIRAMQIIDELEPTRRGPYAGAVGYIDYSGDMDTCIALRTIVHQAGENGQGTYDIQAGAGVVADSDPASEYEETMNKAKAMLKAVDIARKGF